LNNLKIPDVNAIDQVVKNLTNYMWDSAAYANLSGSLCQPWAIICQIKVGKYTI
jgi:hypothetical protein